MNEQSKNNIIGTILIKDIDSDEIILETTNAVHNENLSVAIANALANKSDGIIQEMHFGNGGSVTSGTGAITYFPSNTIGVNADLYNPTYYKVVNDNSPLNTNTIDNNIKIRHISGTVYTDLIITCTLDYSEPSGQEAFDDVNSTEGEFMFDEIGLKTFDPIPGNGYLLSHAIFNPVQKSLNRRFQIFYTLRISLY